MRIIFIRHGESQNNIDMMMLKRADYEEKRTHDPFVSDIGIEASKRLGQELKKLGF